jgi:transcriptional regulator with XRE-family HTH domain
MAPTTKDLKSFGRALRRERTARNLTQVQLARELGLSSKSVCAFEYGVNWPSMPAYIALCRFFGQQAPFLA